MSLRQRLVLILAVLIGWGVQAQQADQLSLEQAIELAITNNPTQQANRLIVEAAHEEARAQRRDDFLPSFNVNVGATRGGLGPSTSTGGLYQASGWNVSQIVYDGGARKNRVAAADMQVEAMEAEYNSTNAFIQDTSGALAAEVFEYYSNMAMIKLSLELNHDRVSNLQQVSPFVRDMNAQAKLRNALTNYTSSIESNRQSLQNLKRDFEHILFATIPDHIDSLEVTNEKMMMQLQDYSNVEYAIEVAKQKNQNFLARLYNLKATEASAQATRAELTRPRVSVVVSDNWNTSEYYKANVESDTSREGYVGIQVDYSVRAGIKDRLSAASKQVSAARQKKDKAEADFSYYIESYYNKLQTSDRLVLNERKNVLNFKKQIQDFLDEQLVAGGEVTLEEFDILIAFFDDLGKSEDRYYHSLFQAISYRYALLREIGILFESVPAAKI